MERFDRPRALWIYARYRLFGPRGPYRPHVRHGPSGSGEIPRLIHQARLGVVCAVGWQGKGVALEQPGSFRHERRATISGFLACQVRMSGVFWKVLSQAVWA